MLSKDVDLMMSKAKDSYLHLVAMLELLRNTEALQYVNFIGTGGVVFTNDIDCMETARRSFRKVFGNETLNCYYLSDEHLAISYLHANTDVTYFTSLDYLDVIGNGKCSVVQRETTESTIVCEMDAQ